MIVVVNYGTGNLGSIANMLKKIGASVTVSSDPAVVAQAEKIILPGVGAFDNGMSKLAELGLVSALCSRVLQDKVPILGICLGMQFFTAKSEEGTLPGLGWIDAETKRFSFEDQPQLKVPHMGWNTVEVQKPSPLFADMYDAPRFYFVHSYHLLCRDDSDVLTKTTHGFRYCSAVQKGNIFGVQFHPEKSHKFGMKLLENYARM